MSRRRTGRAALTLALGAVLGLGGTVASAQPGPATGAHAAVAPAVGTPVTSAVTAPVTSAVTAEVAPDLVHVRRYVTSVYERLFERRPDRGGLYAWSDLLSTGTPRVAVANAITSSEEFRSRLVTEAYEHYLGRSPDAQGLRYWLGAMAQGRTVAQIGAGFISSDEYWAQSGATPEGWVTRLYGHVLQRRPAPSEVQSWVDALARGASRPEVALGFLLSTEHLSTVVDAIYVRLLDRHLDPSGQATWVGRLQAGARDEDIIGGIIASEEYWAGPGDEPYVNLTLEPAVATITLGQTQYYLAFATDELDSLGHSVTDDAQLRVDGAVGECLPGACTPVTVGDHEISATYAGARATAILRVLPAP